MRTQDDKFAHMRAVFMPIDRDKPSLPFSEYITEHGVHDIVRGSTKYVHHYFARYSIPREGGSVELSVISGVMFYCKPDAPYEVMVNRNDPYGYMTDEGLMILLAKIVAGGTPDVEEEGDTDGL